MSAAATMTTSTHGLTTPIYGGEEDGSTNVSRQSSFRSQSKLREILRDQSRREETNQQQRQQQSTNDDLAHLVNLPSPSSSAAIQSLQMAGQTGERVRRPSLVSSVSAVVLGNSDRGSKQRRELSPNNRDTEGTPSGIQSLHTIKTNMPGQGSPPSALQRQGSLRKEYVRGQELDGIPASPPAAVNVASTEHAPPSRLNRTQSSVTNLSSGVDLKVVILGAQGVGKTSLVHRYTSGQFSASAVPSTIGASFLTKKLIVDGIKVRLQLWDTAGQERFRSMAPMYYRGANAAVIVYDITNPHSFEDVKTWIDELRQNVHSDLVIHIVGSKADLSFARQVDLHDAKVAVAHWTNPTPVPNVDPTVISQSNLSAPTNSFFGSRRGLSQTPPSPSSSPPASPGTGIITSSKGSRIPVLGSLSALTKSSRILERGDNDVDQASNPSTGSSNGGNSNAVVLSPPLQEWDFIEVSEVSAKDNEGIEDVFAGIATRLVERREELEARIAARKRRERESVFLTEENAPAGYSVNRPNNETASGWCC